MLIRALGAMCAALLATSAYADSIAIRGITYAGSGCPAGSVHPNVSADRQAFSLIFDELVAEAGPGIPKTEGRKNCAITVDLRYPAGWSYALKRVDLAGTLALDEGTAGTQEVSAWFQGQAQTTKVRSDFHGPELRDYQISDEIGEDALAWSPCGTQRALNINTSVRVSAEDDAHALMTLDGHEFPFGTFRFVWRRCL